MTQSIGYAAVLPRDETIRLIELVHDPSSPPQVRTQAREALFLANRRLIERIVRRYTSPKSDRESARQAGAIGLLKGIDRIDPAQAGAFYSYFSSYIHGEIAAYGREMNSHISLKSYKGRQAQKVSKAIGQLRAEGKEYSPRIVADRLDLPLPVVLELYPWVAPRQTFHLEPSGDPDEEEAPLEAAQSEYGESGAGLDGVLATLSPDDSWAVLDYLSASGGKPTKLVAIALSRILHPSRQWMLYRK